MRSSVTQTLTYWTKTGENDYGEEEFSDPVVFKGRWEDRNELIRTLQNEEVVSRAIVWTPFEVSIGSMLAQGDHTGISIPEAVGALEVQASLSVPSLRTNQMEYRAIL